jgi:hypothetical protein
MDQVPHAATDEAEMVHVVPFPRSLISTLAGAAALAAMAAAPARAVPIYYTDWTSATVAAAGSASGTIMTPTGPVAVTYTGQVHTPTQTACGTAYWSTNSSIYVSATASNAPNQDPSNPAVQLPTSQRCDMISMTGGAGIGVSTFSFDRPILNPILSVLSLGQNAVFAKLEFDQAFTILSQGAGFFGGGTTRLVNLGANSRGGETLQGNEGHGTIMFTGAFQTLTWTMPVFENWYGFTIGVQGIAVPGPAGAPLLALGLLAIGLLNRARSRRRG